MTTSIDSDSMSLHYAAEEAWDEHVKNLSSEKREVLEEEYLAEMDSVVTGQLHDWESELEETEKVGFIQQYMDARHDDDAD